MDFEKESKSLDVSCEINSASDEIKDLGLDQMTLLSFLVIEILLDTGVS